MIAGALFEVPEGEGDDPFVLVAAGVGDCKAFHISLPSSPSSAAAPLPLVTEISLGSRSGENITDPQDPGGRLGPHSVHPYLPLRFPSLFLLPTPFCRKAIRICAISRAGCEG